jgi:YebC/PmpR family DNA-binding regulatory protein
MTIPSSWLLQKASFQVRTERMGRGWIQGYKDQQAAKKGNLFTKLSKEISVASRLGGADPAGNARLRDAVEEAKKASMPRENIERAIKRGAGTLEGLSYEDIMYEGYGPFGVAVLIEALTDNRNRTVSELKVLFKDHGGNLGEMGSVNWMFNRVGIIEATKSPLPDDLEGEAIEVGAQAVEPHENKIVSFTTDVGDLESVKAALTSRGWTVNMSELGFEAKNAATLDEKQRQVVVEFLGELSSHDDVRRVHPAL